MNFREVTTVCRLQFLRLVAGKGVRGQMERRGKKGREEPNRKTG
jgi:hypothetical protein